MPKHERKNCFASNPIAAQFYKENQEKWLKLSADTINLFIQNVTLSTFEKAYDFLSAERQKIAVLLGHGHKENRTKHYGVRRNTDIGEFFSENKSINTGWQEITDLVYESVWQLINNLLKNPDIKPIPSENSDKHESILWLESCEYRGPDYILTHDTFLQKRKIGEKQIEEFIIYIKNEEKEIDGKKVSPFLSRIHLRKYTHPTKEDEPDFNQILLHYAKIKKETLPGDLLLLERYFQTLCSTQHGDIEAFLKHAARLAHLMAQLTLVRLGNASITEWMLRGVAFKKGIDLGPFNHSESLGWDIKALLTPNRNDYTQWFVSSAFSHPQLLSPKQRQGLFTFQTCEEKPELAISPSAFFPAPTNDADLKKEPPTIETTPINKA